MDSRHTRTHLRWLLAGALSLGVFSQPGTTGAQSGPAAQALFDEAIELLKVGRASLRDGQSEIPPSIQACRTRKSTNDPSCNAAEDSFRKACKKLRESVRLEATPLSRYRLAACFELIDRRASAWEAWKLAVPGLGADDAKFANDRIEDLKGRLPYLIVHVSQPTRELSGIRIIQVREDGEEREEIQLEPPLWDAKLPLDGGRYTIRVRADGHEPWETSIDIDDDASGKPPWEITIPALASQPVATGAPTSTSTVGPPEAPVWQAGIGWTSFAIGAAGLAAGAIAGGVALSQWSTANSQCSSHQDCSVATRKLGDEAGTWADVSTAGFAVAGAGAAGALLFLLILPRSPQKTALPMVTPVAGRTYVGGALTGRF